jgi:hypothetical protein
MFSLSCQMFVVFYLHDSFLWPLSAGLDKLKQLLIGTSKENGFGSIDRNVWHLGQEDNSFFAVVSDCFFHMFHGKRKVIDDPVFGIRLRNEIAYQFDFKPGLVFVVEKAHLSRFTLAPHSYLKAEKIAIEGDGLIHVVDNYRCVFHFFDHRIPFFLALFTYIIQFI